MSTSQAHPIADTDELPPDTRLLDGRYVVDIRIGQGGAATVYAATGADGEDVALKIMTAAHAENPTSRQRFHNEVVLAQHLADHPNVVTPHELGELPELDGRPFIAMPLVKGQSLLLLLGRLPVLDALTLIRDIAEVVADVHDRGIVHRDIKPGNVIVQLEGERRVPFLLDFGLAYSDGAGSAPVSERLTAFHELPGTKHYMAPEQILGADPDPRFDVYALGITAVEVLTGIVPLHDLSPADAARRKCDATLPSLSIAGKVPELPAQAERVIDEALARDPDERTASARLFAEQLTEVLGAMNARRSQPRMVAVPDEWAEAEPGEEADEESRSAAAATGAGSATAEPDAPEPRHSAREDAQTTKLAVVSEGEPRSSSRRVIVWFGSAAAILVILLGLGLILEKGPARAESSKTAEQGEPRAMGLAASSGGLVDGGSSGPAEVEAESGGAQLLDEPEGTTSVGQVDTEEPMAPPLDPEPKVEPLAPEVPATEPSVEPEARTPRPAPKKDVPSVDCERVVAEANAASHERRWDRVLQLTKRARCWDDRNARVWLRLVSLLEAGRFGECVELGKKAKKPELVRIAEDCAKHLDKETPR